MIPRPLKYRDSMLAVSDDGLEDQGTLKTQLLNTSLTFTREFRFLLVHTPGCILLFPIVFFLDEPYHVVIYFALNA